MLSKNSCWRTDVWRVIGVHMVYNPKNEKIRFREVRSRGRCRIRPIKQLKRVIQERSFVLVLTLQLPFARCPKAEVLIRFDAELKPSDQIQ